MPAEPYFMRVLPGAFFVLHCCPHGNALPFHSFQPLPPNPPKPSKHNVRAPWTCIENAFALMPERFERAATWRRATVDDASASAAVAFTGTQFSSTCARSVAKLDCVFIQKHMVDANCSAACVAYGQHTVVVLAQSAPQRKESKTCKGHALLGPGWNLNATYCRTLAFQRNSDYILQLIYVTL